MAINRTKLVTKQPAKAKQSVRKPKPYKGKPSSPYSSTKGKVSSVKTASKNYRRAKMRQVMDTDRDSK